MRQLRFSALVLIGLLVGFNDGTAGRHEPDLKLLDSFHALLRGFEATETKKHDLAIAFYTQVIEAAVLPATELSTAHRARGDAYFQKNFTDIAVRDYARALILNPHNAAAYINRSNIRTHQGRYRDALNDLSNAIKLDPHDALAFQVRGNVHFYVGQFGRAITDYRRSLGLDPSDLFSAIWLYLAKSRAGENGRTDLLTHSKNLDLGIWPGPVVSLFLGDITPKELIRIAKRSSVGDRTDVVSEAYFYGAEYYLLRRNRETAVNLFRRVITRGASNLMEFTGAKVELERLER